MKRRTDYVSNSSSSSFLVPGETQMPFRVESFSLPEEIWKAIERNHIDWNDKRLDLSSKSDKWRLTRMISDCEEEYETVAGIPGAVQYLEGNDAPYGWYDDDGESNYVVLKKDGCEFYVFAGDITGRSPDDLPKSVWLRDRAKEIFAGKMGAKQKLTLLKHIFDF